MVDLNIHNLKHYLAQQLGNVVVKEDDNHLYQIGDSDDSNIVFNIIIIGFFPPTKANTNCGTNKVLHKKLSHLNHKLNELLSSHKKKLVFFFSGLTCLS